MIETEENLTEAARKMVTLAVPERSDELRDLWEKYDPVFNLASDTGSFRLEGGPFRLVLMTPRSMWITWLLTQEAWAALTCYGTTLCVFRKVSRETRNCFGALLQTPSDQEEAENELDRYVQGVEKLREGIDLSQFRWPSENAVPSPSRPSDPIGAAVYDLACLTVAAMFLHEVHHVIELTDCVDVEAHDSEYNSDSFAKEFMMSRVGEYSTQSEDSANKVASKRAISLGIFCFAIMRIMGHNKDSESHPAPSKRLRRMLDGCDLPPEDNFWIVMCALFLSQLRSAGTLPERVTATSLDDLAWELFDIVESI